MSCFQLNIYGKKSRHAQIIVAGNISLRKTKLLKNVFLVLLNNRPQPTHLLWRFREGLSLFFSAVLKHFILYSLHVEN